MYVLLRWHHSLELSFLPVELMEWSSFEIHTVSPRGARILSFAIIVAPRSLSTGHFTLKSHSLKNHLNISQTLKPQSAKWTSLTQASFVLMVLMTVSYPRLATPGRPHPTPTASSIIFPSTDLIPSSWFKLSFGSPRCARKSTAHDPVGTWRSFKAPLGSLSSRRRNLSICFENAVFFHSLMAWTL